MRYVLIIFLLSSGILLTAQSDCSVKMDELHGTYSGKCKNGLAHGQGKAVGKEETYEGRFKYGLPDGYGTYSYVNGEVYTGKWKKGRRFGRGTYIYWVNGEETRQEGYWEDDVYIGPKRIKPYKVIRKRSLDRYKFFRVDDGQDVQINITQSGMKATDIQNLMVYGSSGSQIPGTYNIGYHNVTFPFKCKVNYKTWNKLRTVQYDVVFEFEIIKPGKWNLTLTN